MYETLAILATFALVYGAVAGGVERTWLSGPIVFTAFGLLIGDTFALLTWVLFGATVIGQVVQHISGPILLYSVLSLTVARMLPVFVSVAGLGISTQGLRSSALRRSGREA
jgi:hypothetical protein